MGCMYDIRDDVMTCSVCGYSEKQAKIENELCKERLPVETILDGRYILGRLLSFTDFSFIYNAWDALLEMHVAIREYFPSMFAFRNNGETDIRYFDLECKDRFEVGQGFFESDAQKLFLIQSMDEVPDYYRIIRANNTSYIVMEYLKGITLEDFVVSGKADQQWSSRNTLNRIRTALDQLHQKGVLHLNLSPDNIYLCDGGRICLIDQGGAKAEVYRATGCESAFYQNDFIAPEVIHGEKGTRESDLYSMGCICYYLLTGNDPKRSNLKSLKGLSDKKSDMAKMIKSLTNIKPEQRVIPVDKVNSRR